MPVGKIILGRMFYVFGNTIDQLDSLPEMEWRNIHQILPLLSNQSTKFKIFLTGINAIDILIPLELGCKAGLWGGTGVGKTVLLTKMIHNIICYQTRVSVCFAVFENNAGKVRNYMMI